MRLFRPDWLATALVLLLAARGPGAPSATAPTTAPATADAEALARQIEAGVARGDPSASAAAVDDAAVFDAAVAGLELTPAVRADLWDSAKHVGHGFAQGIADQVRAGGTYKFLRVQGDAAQQRLWFRYVNGELSLNYHELVVRRDQHGRLRVTDVHSAVSGEPISQSIRRLILPALLANGQNVGVTFTNRDRAWVKHRAEVQQFKDLARAGKSAEAIAVYDRLPAALRGDKGLMLTKAQILMRQDDARAYAAALAEYQTLFPNDPSLAIVSVDALFLAKKHDAALAAIDRLDRQVGGDPFLDLYRGTALAAKGDVAKARGMFERLLEVEPSLVAPYFNLINMSIERKDFAETDRLLASAEQRTGIRFDHLATIAGFEEFLKSEHGARWVRQRTPAPPPPA